MLSEPGVLLLEFNELCPSLMGRWIEEGKLPNLARLRAESHVFQTEADEKPPALEPWIQWVNVHTGVPFSEHGVFHLRDAQPPSLPSLWDVLTEHQRRVWVCGSMNVRWQRPPTGAMLPDPWATDVSPLPAELLPYFRFVHDQVAEHTNDRRANRRDQLAFLAFMVRHGLSWTTVAAIVRQLMAERLRSTPRWRRAVLLDKLQFDVFRWYYPRLRPHFSTFFLNSTAHYQHLYWRHMAPELFKNRPHAAELAEYQDAILFGYQQMDQLIARFVDLTAPGTTLMFCTALSQQPCLTYEEQGGKVFYRPRDFGRLLALLGVRGAVTPSMSEVFQVRFASEEEARAGAVRLRALRVGSEPILDADILGDRVCSGCTMHRQLPADARLTVDGTGIDVPFFEIFYQAAGIKSGMHHPDGMLWIRTPSRAHAVHAGSVSLQSIAPTILEMLGVPVPAHMRAAPLLAAWAKVA